MSCANLEHNSLQPETHGRRDPLIDLTEHFHLYILSEDLGDFGVRFELKLVVVGERQDRSTYACLNICETFALAEDPEFEKGPRSLLAKGGECQRKLSQFRRVPPTIIVGNNSSTTFHPQMSSVTPPGQANCQSNSKS